jgi:hypothetical protein
MISRALTGTPACSPIVPNVTRMPPTAEHDLQHKDGAAQAENELVHGGHLAQVELPRLGRSRDGDERGRQQG